MSDGSLDVLVVCTANVCRSPLAEALLAHHAAASGLDLDVASAGLDPVRRAVHPTVVRLLAERELAPAKTHSDPVTDDRVDRADLVITMTGAHAIETAARHRSATRRIFVLDHAVQVLPPLTGLPRADWSARIDTIARSYPRHPGTVDVPDPINGSESMFRAVADQLDRLCSGLVSALGGPA